MSFLAINLIFRCCNDEALNAYDNAIKVVNLCVKSLLELDNCELTDILSSNKAKLIQTPRQMYSETVVALD